ncbi:MAG: hypothetical protein IJK26_09995 [Clostridia bacterium]|nr:hypothetical protein [Clostridia bacterium]
MTPFWTFMDRLAEGVQETPDWAGFVLLIISIAFILGVIITAAKAYGSDDKGEDDNES